MFKTFLLALAAVATVASASRVPEGWKWTGRSVAPLHHVRLQLALQPKEGGMQTLEQTLHAIATPGSPDFHEYLSHDQLRDMVAPPAHRVQAVVDWLASAGVKDVEVHRHSDWIFADTTVETVENLFSTRLLQYHNAETKQSTLYAPKYSIPEEFEDIISFVAGLQTFPPRRWGANSYDATANGAEPATAVTPQTIYEVYGTPQDGSHGSRMGSQSVVEFGQIANFSPDDLEQFFLQYTPELSGETYTSQECDVCMENRDDGLTSVEAQLDVEYQAVVGRFVESSTYKVKSGSDIEDAFLDYATAVNAQDDPALVHSISYGEYGADYDNTTVQRFSYELEKMGARGITVMLASGDNGVGCSRDCSTQEFDFPSSPYITMVGATYLNPDGVEIGAQLSSGGFSQDYWRPSWQDDAVEAYFNSGVDLPQHTDYFENGRAYPDLSAFGENLQIVARGKDSAVSGTSCSAPIFSGIVALINDQLLKAGEAPMGWINPFLYSDASMFTDITEGSNPYECCEGFNAYSGWDPVTGMGTPLYEPMLEAAFAAVGRRV